MEAIIKNTNKEYHSGDGVSKSDLDMLHVCPAKYRYRKDNPEDHDTPALLFGSMVHKLILEPDDFDSEFVIAPECDKRTKAGKQMYDEFLESVGDRKIVTAADREIGLAMRDSVMKDPKAAKLLTGGDTETSYYWNDERTGVLCKCRPDKVNLNYIIDLKTTEDASRDGFARSLLNFRYYVQAAWYLKGYEAATGIKPDGFIFVAVEKKPPYATAIYVVNDATIEIGTKEAAEDLDTFVRCTESGNWYGYGGENNDAMTIDLPSWALKRKESAI